MNKRTVTRVFKLILTAGLNYFLCSCENTKTPDKSSISSNPVAIEKGNSLFALHCVACHNFNQDGIGPRLGGVTDMVSKDYVFKFIKNPQSIIQSGDNRAQSLFDKYHTVMPSFEHLPQDDIESLIAYLHTKKAVPNYENQLGFEELNNPILEPISKDGLVVELELVCQIPPSSDHLPYTRITKLISQPTTDELFVVDLRGQLYSIQNKKPQLYLDLNQHFPNFIHQPGLGSGFGSFAFHPDWAINGILYTTHTEKSGSKKADFSYADSIPTKIQWVLTEWKTMNPKSNMFIGENRELLRINMVDIAHGVQEITFNPVAKHGENEYGLLYMGIGDGTSVLNGITSLTQSREKIWGTVIRINPMGNDSRNGKYGIPVDNPWSSSNEPNVLKEIYAFGFRNPHRINWTQTGLMMVANIGEGNIESLYQVFPGKNYGWPIREGSFLLNPISDLNKVYPLPADDDIYRISYPIAQYDHDEGTAISGGYEYSGKDIPELMGKYLFGDITSGRLFYINVNEIQLGHQAEIKEWQVSFNGSTVSMEDLCKNKRVDLRIGKDAFGELYITTKPDGKIYKCISASKQDV